jgi:hypothetical protein
MTPADGWTLTAHACRFCGSRVLQHGDVFACATCEAQTRGGPVGICGCGMHLGPVPKTARQIEQMKLRKPLGFACMPNSKVCDLAPAVIVIGFAGQPAPAPVLKLEAV